MTGLSLSLPIGVLSIAIVFFVLYRLTPLNAKQAAMAMSVISIGAYTGFAAISQHSVDIMVMHVAVFLVTCYILGIIGSRFDRSAAERGERWFHWGPALIVMFFVVVITVDAVFVTLSMEGLPSNIQHKVLPATGDRQKASTAFPGVVHRNYYQKEKQFNRYLQGLDKQEQRGWKVRKGWLTARPTAGDVQVFQLAVTDKDGKPVAGAKVAGIFLRPSDSRLDVSFRMDEFKPGWYRVGVKLPAAGLWNLRMVVQRGDELHQIHATTTIYRKK